jgi:hypothetical protein
MRLDSPGDRSADIVKAERAIIRRRNAWPGAALVVLGFAAATGPAAEAATFPELYTVSVAPDPAAPNIRTDAIRRAMSVLLARITGRRQPAEYPEMDALIRNASDFVTSYSPAAAEIRVGFSRNELNASLTRLNLPIWGEERPATLVWIAVDLGAGQRSEIMADTPPAGRPVVAGAASFPLNPDAAMRFAALVDELVTAADQRGLPIVLPLLDAEDRVHVSFADVWGGFDPFVARAAERYAVDAVLIGRVTVSELGVDAHWTLQRGERRQTRVTADMYSAIDWIAEEFAAQFITVGGARLTWITVRGIERWSDYGRVMEYLQSVSIVESVDPESMADGALVLRLAARGNDDTLREYLTLDGVLNAFVDDSIAITASTDGTGSLVFVPSWLTDPGSVLSP